MSGYSDDRKDYEQRTWVAKWVPENEDLPPWTPENQRFWLARARSAEAEVDVYRHGLRSFADLLERAKR